MLRLIFVPAYFETTEALMICYKYCKPTHNAIFNFNKLVAVLDTENNAHTSRKYSNRNGRSICS